MKLNFTKVGERICPTDEAGALLEDVLKCTVTSAEEQPTIMTLTVVVPVADSIDLVPPHTIGGIWECDSFECHTRKIRCTHFGSKPRLCVDDRGQTVPWRKK